jgi:hypothetical protein
LILHLTRGVSTCGPCRNPRNKFSCTWSSRRWARRSAQTPLLAGRAQLLQALPLLCTAVSSFQPLTSSSRHRIFVSDRTIHWAGHGRAFCQSRGATAGSGLRLCVKDGLLQACVLLATPGDNSRIRWSSSQDCQHVLSSDIRSYNKKLLGTSPALHQEVALPTNFIRSISSSAPAFEAGVLFLQGGRRPSTVKSYDKCSNRTRNAQVW